MPSDTVDMRNNSSTQVFKSSSSMLRCAILRGAPKSSQTSLRKPFFSRQSLAKKPCHQTRSLSFLRIVSSHDTTQTKSSLENGLDEHLAIPSPADGNVPDQAALDLRNNTSTGTINDNNDADLQGESPTQPNYFSASLADGTIVHNLKGDISQSQFRDLVLQISQFWKQHSQEIMTELSAENIGIAVLRVPEEWILPGERSSLSTKIYDISEGRGCRTMLRCRWSIRENHRGFAMPGTKDKRMNWSQTRRLLLSGLENHIG
jgi:hypothetical protein